MKIGTKPNKLYKDGYSVQIILYTLDCRTDIELVFVGDKNHLRRASSMPRTIVWSAFIILGYFANTRSALSPLTFLLFCYYIACISIQSNSIVPPWRFVKFSIFVTLNALEYFSYLGATYFLAPNHTENSHVYISHITVWRKVPELPAHSFLVCPMLMLGSLY